MSGLQNDQFDLGTLISALYDEFLDIYGDEDLAAVATAATIQSLLNEEAEKQEVDQEEGAPQ